MCILDEIKNAYERKYTKKDRTIVGIWATDCMYNPIGNGRVFNYKYIVVQTNIGQGCAYSENYNYDTKYLLSLVGEDCLSNRITDKALQVACIDSLADNNTSDFSTELFAFNGKSIEKLRKRSELIINEAKKLLGDINNKKILNVGVVGDILKTFLENGCQVIGSDFDPEIIGKKLFDDIQIVSGEKTLELLKDVDLAVITGMTISTDTIDSIICECKKHGVCTIVFAETGANLGAFYVNKGIDCYIGERYPFYIFNGSSEFIVTRRI